MTATVKALVALDANKLLGLKQVCKVSTQPIAGAPRGAEAEAGRLLSKVGEIPGDVSRLLSKIGEIPTVEISRLLSKIGEIQ
jgi:hypothetical protein